MYLHLENNILIPKGKVLGLFDLDNTSWEKTSREFLRLGEKEGRVFSLSVDIPRSFVLVEEDFGNVTIYLSGKSTDSLKKRMEEKFYLEENKK